MINLCIAILNIGTLIMYRILASDEVLSTDEEASDSGGSDIEEMAKNIESLLTNKKTSHQVE